MIMSVALRKRIGSILSLSAGFSSHELIDSLIGSDAARPWNPNHRAIRQLLSAKIDGAGNQKNHSADEDLMKAVGCPAGVHFMGGIGQFFLLGEPLPAWQRG